MRLPAYLLTVLPSCCYCYSVLQEEKSINPDVVLRLKYLLKNLLTGVSTWGRQRQICTFPGEKKWEAEMQERGQKFKSFRFVSASDLDLVLVLEKCC